VFYSSCDKKEQVPAYLHIKSFSLKTIPSKEGENSLKAPDAWVYYGGNLLGAFTLPADVPILAEGNSEISIVAGVRDNGDNSTPNEYFHYQPIKVQKTLIAGKFDTVAPVLEYDKTIKFRWMEDFESNLNSLSNNVDSDPVTSIKVTSVGAKYGKFCGLLAVDKDHPIVSVASQTLYDKLPQKNRVYVEIDYKSDVPLLVELYGVEKNGTPKFLDSANFRDRSEWNKAYVNFSKSVNTTFDLYQVVFTAILPLDSNGKPMKDSGEVRVDNLKLIHP
jgi:hypothetical protein